MNDKIQDSSTDEKVSTVKTFAELMDGIDDFESLSAESMEDVYASTFQIKDGEIVNGTIVGFESDFILVDVGYKSEGLVPRLEFPSRGSELIIGDPVEVFVENCEDEDGVLVLSKEKANRIKIWDELTLAYEKEENIDVGYFLIFSKDIEAFDKIPEQFFGPLKEWMIKQAVPVPEKIRFIGTDDSISTVPEEYKIKLKSLPKCEGENVFKWTGCIGAYIISDGDTKAIDFNVGDEKKFSYLPSRKGNTISDKIAKYVLGRREKNFKKFSWLDRGSDERQYSSPGFRTVSYTHLTLPTNREV